MSAGETTGSRELGPDPLNPELTLALGSTVFEALAEDSASAVEASERTREDSFTSSLTRRNDGQTTNDDF